MPQVTLVDYVLPWSVPKNRMAREAMVSWCLRKGREGWEGRHCQEGKGRGSTTVLLQGQPGGPHVTRVEYPLDLSVIEISTPMKYQTLSIDLSPPPPDLLDSFCSWFYEQTQQNSYYPKWYLHSKYTLDKVATLDQPFLVILFELQLYPTKVHFYPDKNGQYKYIYVLFQLQVSGMNEDTQNEFKFGAMHYIWVRLCNTYCM